MVGSGPDPSRSACTTLGVASVWPHASPFPPLLARLVFFGYWACLPLLLIHLQNNIIVPQFQILVQNSSQIQLTPLEQIDKYCLASYYICKYFLKNM